MKKIVVIGGGLAGISAAVTLIKNNISVQILEASPKIGGRAKAFKSKTTNILLDNGQHLLLSCYKDTLQLFNTINPNKKYLAFNGLTLPFIFKGGKKYIWKIPNKYYPFNLLSALSKFKLLSSISKLKLSLQLFTLIFESSAKNETVEIWLKKFSQEEDAIKYFWEMIGIGALNSSFNQAGAIYFRNILKEMFIRNKAGYKFVIPSENLTDYYCLGAQNYILSKGNKINTSERVISLIVNNKRLIKIITNKNTFTEFDGAIITLPLHSLKKILFNHIPRGLLDNYIPSAIISAHVFLRRKILKHEYAYLVDSEFDWAFNHGEYLTLVKSAADSLINLNIDTLKELVKEELKKYFPGLMSDDFDSIEIIKERRATFKATPQFSSAVENFKPNFENLEFAGDWLIPNLPATMESAVRSGRLAAEKILEKIK